MPQVVPWPVKRGRLSDDEIATIEAMGEAGQTPGRIARRLGRHPSTVNYRLVSAGLRPAKPQPHREPHTRGGRVVRPFLPAEDAFIQERRIAGDSWPKIAAAVECRFGWSRPKHSIGARLMQLAGEAP